MLLRREPERAAAFGGLDFLTRIKYNISDILVLNFLEDQNLFPKQTLSLFFIYGGKIMQLKEQTAILTIAKYRNITKAAKELYVTQPALSMFLNNVEQQLGTKLFDRQGKPMKLTPAGALYVKKAEQMMRIKAEFDLELSKILSTHGISITIGIQPIRVPHLEPPLRSVLQERFPNMHLKITEGICGDLSQIMQEDRIDFILSNSTLYTKQKYSFAEQKVRRDHLLLAVSKEHPVAQKYRGIAPKPPVDVRMFKDDVFLLNEPNTSIRLYTDSLFQILQWRPSRWKEYPRTELNIAFTAQGRGVAFLLSSYTNYMRSRALDYFPIAGSDRLCCDIVLQYKDGRFPPDFVTAIRDCSMEALKIAAQS